MPGSLFRYHKPVTRLRPVALAAGHDARLDFDSKMKTWASGLTGDNTSGQYFRNTLHASIGYPGFL